MLWKIAADSSCDLREGIEPVPGLTFSIVPLKIRVGTREFVDDCGLDMEELNRPIRLETARRVLSSAEYAQFEAAPDKRRAFLTFWVLKEARVKCDGTGLLGFPNRTDFTLRDPRVWEMEK